MKLLTLGIAIIGLLGGIISGLLGVGGGVIMVPALTVLAKLPIKTAIGTSLAVIVPTALAGAITHHKAGHIDLKIALTLAPLAILGGLLGAWLVTQIPADTLKRVFGGLIVIVGFQMIFTK